MSDSLPKPEQLAWARHHQEEKRHHAAEIANVRHPGADGDLTLEREEVREHEQHEQSLHDSQDDQIRHHEYGNTAV
jgi:hypothetical protein